MNGSVAFPAILNISYAAYLVSTRPEGESEPVAEQENGKTRLYRYRPRLLTWIRQLSLAASIGYILIYLVCSLRSENGSIRANIAQLHVELLVILVLLCLYLIYDGLAYRFNKDYKTKWLWSYITSTITSFLWVLSQLNGTDGVVSPVNIVLLTSFTIALIASSLDIFFIHDEMHENETPLEYTCGLLDYFSFSYLNELMILKAYRNKSLKSDEIPKLFEINTAEIVWRNLNHIERKDNTSNRNKVKRSSDSISSINDNNDSGANNQSKQGKSFRWTLFKLIKNEWLRQGMFQFCISSQLILPPLCLETIIAYIAGTDLGNCILVRLCPSTTVWGALLLLVLSNLINCFAAQQLFHRGRHCGIVARSAIITAVFNKLLVVDISNNSGSTNINNDSTDNSNKSSDSYADSSPIADSNEGVSVGRINNLISVDAGEIQMFCCYSHQIWGSTFEILIAVSILYILLGKSSLVGLVLMAAFISSGLYLSKRQGDMQDHLMNSKDARMSVINQLLISVRVVKLFSLEKLILEKVSRTRGLEINNLWHLAVLKSCSFTLTAILPVVVTSTTLLFGAYFSSSTTHTLTPSQGLTTLLIFGLLQHPINTLLDMVSTLLMMKVSLDRIESFLDMPEIKGRELSEHGTVNKHDALLSLRNLTFYRHHYNGANYSKTSDQSQNNPFGDCSAAIRRFCNCAIWRRDGYEVLQSTDVTSNATSQSPPGWDLSEAADKSESGISLSYMSGGKNDTYSSNTSNNSDGPDILSNDNSVDIELGDGSSVDFFDPELSSFSVIHNLSCQINRGDLVVIVGPTGCGKSTLLSLILGECRPSSGEIACSSVDMCYTSQSPWIKNCSLKDNIVFGSHFDQSRYDAVIDACALKRDIMNMQCGDLTEIGEKGVNLSIGQQMRVDLARCAYNSASCGVVLLDDPLSAVDSSVSSHLLNSLILGFLGDKTRLLCTHQLSSVIPHADLIIYMNKGDISFQRNNKQTIMNKTTALGLSSAICCSPDDMLDLLTNDSDFLNCNLGFNTSLIRALSLPRNKSISPSSSFSSLPISNSISTSSSSSSGGSSSSSSLRNATLINDLDLSKAISNDIDGDSIDLIGDAKRRQTDGRITVDEEKSSGTVNVSTYAFYLNAIGGSFFGMFLVGIGIATVVGQCLQNYSLGLWINSLQSQSSSKKQSIFIFFILSSVIFIVMTLVRNIVHCLLGLKASKFIHLQLTKSIMMANMFFFESVPQGRIVNRFSQDISTVDSHVMMDLQWYFDCILGVLQTVAIIAISFPVLLLPLIPIAYISILVSNMYISVSTELKRFDSNLNSTVFVVFSEAIQGIVTIRNNASFEPSSNADFSSEKSKRRINGNCERLVARLFNALDASNSSHLYMWHCNRWLNFRMQILGAIVTAVVGLASIIVSRPFSSPHEEVGNDADNVGGKSVTIMSALALIYSLNFTDYLTFLARTRADNEMNFNSVERIEEYCKIKSERYLPTDNVNIACVDNEFGDNSIDYSNERNPLVASGSGELEVRASKPQSVCCQVDFCSHGVDSMDEINISHSIVPSSSDVDSNWPSRGHIVFDRVCMRYETSADLILKNLSFSIPSRCKVGIVGRTGAGKSSLIATLFRLIELESGSLRIDDVDIADISLHSLRSRMSIVPQEALLLNGSLRENLDPFNEYSDEVIWEALDKVRLKEYFLKYYEKNMNKKKSSDSLSDADGSKTIKIETNSTYTSSSCDSWHYKSILDNSKTISDNGMNLSVGQRQLLCLARVLVRNVSDSPAGRIIVLDECTANIDLETDNIIQNVIINELKHSTILTIAHRLQTIIKYDMIIVLGDGRVIESGTPYELLSKDDWSTDNASVCREKSFKAMCENSGDFAHLLSLAREKHMLDQ